MNKRVTQSYTPEFRTETVKLVIEQGMSVFDAAVRLGMDHGTLAYSATQACKGMKQSAVSFDVQSVESLMAEVRQLRKELAETRKY